MVFGGNDPQIFADVADIEMLPFAQRWAEGSPDLRTSATSADQYEQGSAKRGLSESLNVNVLWLYEQSLLEKGNSPPFRISCGRTGKPVSGAGIDNHFD